jgi:hypothetical protein
MTTTRSHGDPFVAHLSPFVQNAYSVRRAARRRAITTGSVFSDRSSVRAKKGGCERLT